MLVHVCVDTAAHMLLIIMTFENVGSRDRKTLGNLISPFSKINTPRAREVLYLDRDRNHIQYLQETNNHGNKQAI